MRVRAAGLPAGEAGRPLHDKETDVKIPVEDAVEGIRAGT